MPNRKFDIDINGYWLDIHKGGIPNHSGVYFVYECTYNQDNDNVTIHKLIYIGESDTVRDRISTHEKYTDWTKHVRKGNTLCYSTGPIEPHYRQQVEAAYIFQHKPPENDTHIDSFDFDQTTIISNGRNALLITEFTLNAGIDLG